MQPDGAKVSQFLSVFYPDENETIWLRTFDPKDAPYAAEYNAQKIETSRRRLATDKIHLGAIGHINRRQGIYFVVNAGGNRDEDITRFNAFYSESDDRSIEEQHRILDQCHIQPSIRIETAKSVHAYWLITEACSVDQWKQVQRGLIQYFNSDPKIKNPSRVMRVPGFSHVSQNCKSLVYKQIQISHFEPDKRFTAAEMLAAFPAVEAKAQGAQAAGEDPYPNWEKLLAELRRRFHAHSTFHIRPDLEWADMKGICHGGTSNSGLALNLISHAVFCRKEPLPCAIADILAAFGLPSEPTRSTPWADDAYAPREPGDDSASEPFEDSRHAKSETAHKDPGPPLPQARPWIDITVSPDDKSVLLGPGRWLTLGSGCFLVAPTGVGKSTWTATQALAWGLGRTSLGITPTRPLKSLLIQAEDDDGDLADMSRGILSALTPSPGERDTLRESVLVVTERAATGVRFLNFVVRPLLKQFQPDLLWLNPLSAYFGADLNDQEAVALFFRATLNPILAAARCAAMVAHHTPKPSKERKDWTGSELAYLGAGSGDLANWSRETISLRQTAPGLFEMGCAKRWRKLGWRDADGKPTAVRLIAHGTNGSMFWRDADAEILKELGTQPYSESAFLALVPESGIDKAVLIEDVSNTFSVSERTAIRYVVCACRPHQRMVDGKPARVALLSVSERARKEVYPDAAGNRNVVWLTRL